SFGGSGHSDPGYPATPAVPRSLQERTRAQATLAVVFECPDPEVLDLMCGLARALGKDTVQRTAEHAPQQFERLGRHGTAATARTRPAQRAPLFEVERHQLG